MNDSSSPAPPPDGAYGDATPFRPKEPEPLLARTIPVSGELSRYRFPKARKDLVAGVTVAALALPSAMAYGNAATRTGIPPNSTLVFDLLFKGYPLQ